MRPGRTQLHRRLVSCVHNLDSDNLLNQAIRLRPRGPQGRVSTPRQFLDGSAYDEALGTRTFRYPLSPESQTVRPDRKREFRVGDEDSPEKASLGVRW